MNLPFTWSKEGGDFPQFDPVGAKNSLSDQNFLDRLFRYSMDIFESMGDKIEISSATVPAEKIERGRTTENYFTLMKQGTHPHALLITKQDVNKLYSMDLPENHRFKPYQGIVQDSNIVEIYDSLPIENSTRVLSALVVQQAL